MKIVGSKQNLIGEYDNGNYHVMLYNDGTKIRQTDDDSFIPDFPECIDMMITYACDGGCPFCYISGGSFGLSSEFHQYKPFLDSIRPYTEIAINGNDLTYRYLDDFLEYMKERNVIVNLTVSQKHFERSTERLHTMMDKGLIHGLGVSFERVDDKFLADVKTFNNVVLHVIAGIITPLDIRGLEEHNLNILILGYKKIGRGLKYYEMASIDIDWNIEYMKNNLKSIVNKFKIISFDNLAIEQLDVKSILSKEEFDKIYMGDDGEFTFFVDLVKGNFAKSSLDIDTNTHKLTKGMTVDDCFKIVRRTI